MDAALMVWAVERAVWGAALLVACLVAYRLGAGRAVAGDVHAADRRSMDPEWFRRLFEASPSAIVLSRVADGTILDVNPAFERLSGYARDQLCGRSALDLGLWANPAERERIREQLERRGRAESMDATMRTQGGAEISILISTEIVVFEGEALALGSAQDITERRRVHEQLSISERKLAAIFRLSPVALALASLKSGRILQVNRGWEELFGRLEAQVLGCDIRKIGLYPDESMRARLGKQLVEEGRLRSLDLSLQRADGTLIDVLGAAEIVSIDGEDFALTACVDVTAQRSAERERMKSERMFEALFRLNPVAVALVHADSGRFVDVNRGFEEVHRVSRGEILGRTVEEAGIYPNARVRQQLLGRLREKKSLRDVELSRRLPDGSEVHLSGNAELMRVDDEDYLVSAAVDVTKLKDAQRRLLDANRELEQRVADRTRELRGANADLKAFSYLVAHDLAGPLRSIDGFSAMIERDSAERLPERDRERLKRVRRGAASMREMMDGLLTLSRVVQGQLRIEEVDLTGVARETIGRLRSSGDERHVEFDVQDGLVAMADPRLARILLANLLGNAWKFTQGKERARIRFLRSADGAFVVEDNGEGFAPELADQLFEPFRRFHESCGWPGEGVGLASVKRIMSRHGGWVRAEGQPGRGARFVFWFDAYRVAPG